MKAYKNIEKKLHEFVRKFYTNELIKGGILFLSLGFLYLFFTLFLEYFLWLKPTARTLLFWVFICVEMYLMFRFILTPIFKLIGLRKGISFKQSSRIIGEHFPKVGDKLINVLQLKEATNQSDLLLASITQKAVELQPIPFAKAINFKSNLKYLKYAAIPLAIWLLVMVSGNINVFHTSLTRVVNHRTAYAPPAPFSFELISQDLKVVQGQSFTVEITTKGVVAPSDVLIFYNNQSYFLHQDKGVFKYTFLNPEDSLEFYVEANGVTSDLYELYVIKTPTIKKVSVGLEYPKYILKQDEAISNAGNLLIPEGTNVSWSVSAHQTEELEFIEDKLAIPFSRESNKVFVFRKKIKTPLAYQISTSNTELKNFETLNFSIDVIKDEYPKIEVVAEIDSLAENKAHFVGKILDDYGLTGLELVYYDKDASTHKLKKNLAITSKEDQTFFVTFPGELTLKEGVDYELYFEVYDNDGVNGRKKTVSRIFTFRNKSKTELDEEAFIEQRNQLKSIEKTLQKKNDQKKALKEIEEELQSKKNVDWNDKKKIEDYIKRQEQYKRMMQRQTDKLHENLKDLPRDSKSLTQKKEELKKRIEELKKLEKEERLLEELKKLASKLNKEDLLKKVKKLAAQNKQEERGLERVLELTKRFYVEQKTMQIANKLQDLSKKQDSLSVDGKSNLNKQKEIRDKFSNIQKEIEELQKDNKKLKEPIQIPSTEKEEREVNESLKKSEERNSGNQKKAQKNASRKMQEMSRKMRQAMEEASGEMAEANEKSLRIILENLLNYSFRQENSMDRFSNINVEHPNFGAEIKKQHILKTYFEHIDDSLYVLSMRLPEISTKIQKDLTDAHYNIGQALDNFADNRFSGGLANQQYVMTAVNNLADFLSDILNQMQQPRMSKPGKGKKGGKSFSLPDIIKNQEELMKQMKEGNKKGESNKGKQKGNSKRNEGNEELDGEVYKLYQKQAQLKEEFQKGLNNGEKSGNMEVRKVLKSFEELENEILEKGFDPGTLKKMEDLNYNLLKLDEATFKQGVDSKRKSTTNEKSFLNNTRLELLKKLFYNQTEILNRQSLPLQKNYKKKVQQYFRKAKSTNKND